MCSRREKWKAAQPAAAVGGSDIEREFLKNSTPCMPIAPSLLYPAPFCVVVVHHLCSAALLVVG